MSELRSLLRAAREMLATDSAALEAEVLLGEVLQRPRSWLYAHDRDTVTPGRQQRFFDLLRRRAEGEPLAYLLGQREFWSLTLQVSPDTLIPRPDTERLVELALQHMPPEHMPPERPLQVVDLGTGSGAIALALAHERPQAHVLAVDRSLAALQIAQVNAQHLGLQRVGFVQSDWSEALGDASCDLIVSNPPYLRLEDPHLQQGDLRYEPSVALLAGADGLDAIRHIVSTAPACLHPGGWLLLEHGFEQGAAVRQLLHDRGLSEVTTELDIEHRERVSLGRVPEK